MFSPYAIMATVWLLAVLTILVTLHRTVRRSHTGGQQVQSEESQN